jgi:hypothetical protein
MSDTNDGNAAGAADTSAADQAIDQTAEQIKNIKSEMSRKLENQNQLIVNTNKQVETLLAKLDQQRAPQAQASTKKLEDMIYEDPTAYTEEVVSRVANTVTNSINEQQTRALKAQQAAIEVQAKYPEFSDVNSDAYKTAMTKYDSLPKHLQGTPEGIKMVMLESASELGLVPASRRSSGDDFSMSSNSSGKKGKNNSDTENEIDPRTVAFAELLSPGRSKKEIRASLKKQVERRSKYNDWKSVKDEE